MTNQEEENKKNPEENILNQINDKNIQDININNKNLLELLTIQVQDSEKKILDQKIDSEFKINNIVNRLNKDLEKSKKFCLEKKFLCFLPIIDNIECALNLLEKKKEDKYIIIIEKMDCTLKFLKSILQEYNIKKIDKINIPFDPEIHQAMSIHYNEKIPSNTVVSIMQSGYIFHGTRLLRPAMVIVSKKK